MKNLFLSLLIIFPGILSAQILNMTSIIRPTNNQPVLSASISSLSGFSTVTGTASASQNFTISGTNLTAGAVVTAPTSYEVSLDNSSFASSKNVSESGGTLVSQPVTIYVRIAASASVGSPSGNVAISSSGASNVNVGVSGTVTGAGPSISVNPTSLSGFSTTQGTQSSSQSYSLTGSNLTANITVTASIGCVVSLDNSSFSGTQTVTESGGSASATIYVAIASTASAGSFSGTVANSSTNATTENVAITGTVTAQSSAQFNFSSTVSAVSGCTNFYGDPTASPSFTNSSTGWTLKAVGSGWVKYDGSYYGGVGNGATSGSTDAAFSQASINSNLYSFNAVGSNSANGYQLEFTNLPAGTYTIEVIGSIPTGVFNNGGASNFEVIFGTGSTNVGTAYNPNGSGTTGNLAAMGPGTTNVTTGSFTGTITSGQLIYISLGYSTSSFGQGNLGFINGLIITKTD